MGLGQIEVALLADLEVSASEGMTGIGTETERVLLLLVAQADKQLLGGAEPALLDHGVVLALRQDGVAVEGSAAKVGNLLGREIEAGLERGRALDEARECALAIGAGHTESRGLRLGLRNRSGRRCNHLPLVGLRGGWVHGVSRLGDCAVRGLRAAWLRLGLWSALRRLTVKLRRRCKAGWRVSGFCAEVLGHWHAALLVSSLEAAAKCGRELVHVLLIDGGCVRDGWQLGHVQVGPDRVHLHQAERVSLLVRWEAWRIHFRARARAGLGELEATVEGGHIELGRAERAGGLAGHRSRDCKRLVHFGYY